MHNKNVATEQISLAFFGVLIFLSLLKLYLLRDTAILKIATCIIMMSRIFRINSICMPMKYDTVKSTVNRSYK